MPAIARTAPVRRTRPRTGFVLCGAGERHGAANRFARFALSRVPKFDHWKILPAASRRTSSSTCICRIPLIACRTKTRANGAASLASIGRETMHEKCSEPMPEPVPRKP